MPAARVTAASLLPHFSPECHLEVDPEPYYRDCLYDMCSCETKLDGCLCPILAAYSKECARKGIIIDWRAEVRECGEYTLLHICYHYHFTVSP